MNVCVLTMSDHDMRPRSDVMTTVVFAKREDALAAMKQDIESALESEQISEAEIERDSESDYVVSTDGRFSWKVEERGVCGA